LYISESRLLYVYTTAPQAFFLILALRFQHFSSSSTETGSFRAQPLCAAVWQVVIVVGWPSTLC
jgi:hypothetical protein